MSEPRRGRPGYDRDGVLDIAVRAFNEFGYDATSMGTLATRLGLSKSAIYHHFDSKEAVLDAALDEGLGALEGVLAEPGALLGSPAARLTFVLERAVHVLVERLPYVTLLLRLRGNTPVERAALERRREFDRAVTALVVDARDAGELRDDIDPRIAERLPYVTLLLRLRGNTPVERAALDRRREFDRAVTALVVEARDAGELRDDIDPRVAERLLFGMINSIVEWYRPEGPEDARRLAADVLAFAADGLRLPRA